MPDSNYQILLLLPAVIGLFWLSEMFNRLSSTDSLLLLLLLSLIVAIAIIVLIYIFSPWAKNRRKQIATLREIPEELLCPAPTSVLMGFETDLDAAVFLPDHIRTRHTHILGSTGSGKTESVILNFLRQDIARGLGSIILDAKGDFSFLSELKNMVDSKRLQIFDLGEALTVPYNPLADGSPLESAQRLFSSFTWSEEYYKSKALATLQRIFIRHFEINGKNPTLFQLADHLSSPTTFSAFMKTENYPQSLAIKDFDDLSGLRDQVNSLTLGHLEKTLSPTNEKQINLGCAQRGTVIYFRLQSLMSPQLVSILGKLVINHLNFLAGTAHRGQVEANAKERRLVPVYFDEFASFACAEFADLISKARSAGFALHFSHQSIGDIAEVSEGFLSRITDNSATKIVLRINDPDSAEFFSRSFGTKQIQKTTQRITNAKDIDSAEIVGEGTTRDAHQFRASPDLLKTLPTGMGAVLIAHGRDTPHGASTVFTIRFPPLHCAKEMDRNIKLRQTFVGP